MVLSKDIAPASAAAQRESFFRQSGWLMIANVGGGALMFAVHLLNRWMPAGQYGNFGAFLAVIMLVPTIPLQMVLAQQTAKALATGTRHELAGVIRWLWLVTLLLWLAAAAVVLIFQRPLLEAWQMNSSAGLWLTMLLVLLSLWTPMFWGVLQGRQNFLWLGWSMISNGLGRVAIAAAAVLTLRTLKVQDPGLYATGMMAGVLLGMVVSMAIAAWHGRDLWLIKPERFEVAVLLRQIVPLFIGFLGFQILFTADTLLVKTYFSKIDSRLPDYYVSAGTLSRALMWLVLPLAAVMFPRLVHSAAKSEKTNLVWPVLLGTFVLAVAGALGLIVLGPFVVKMIYPKSSPTDIIGLLPWYVLAMVPLGLANVLLNNLFARPASKFFPALAVFVLALGYLFALTRFHDSMTMVLQTMGIFNLALLAVAAFFTWGHKPAIG